ncbi:putative electron transport protein YccM [Pseudodesulfovibrio hydrargyri]|uniref:Putative electron transport protein YccM n=1 Tax=Pseudodesulfovibrio hydrargyri TaxID=2125990 RepID=A0A1J5NEK2_9BACT|nr:4Fe-4S dicluster domain-containing protein [Pseudodesulfovibrio hydrargyri]OIQ50145.1 putative electron transport protein YccM [Pseudodesulfovibrio hydrargyri]
MPLRLLKPLRAALAVVFLALTVYLFLDFRETGARYLADPVLYLQFVPSLLAFLGEASLGAAGFIAVLALTLLLGRVYCSTVCPLGTFQDVVGRLFGKKRRGHAFAPARNGLRYGILALTACLFLAGSGLALHLLDPFSNFGRILSNLVRPVVLAANNLAVPLAESFGSSAVYRVQWPVPVPVAVGAALAMLLLVGWLGARHGRLYCNTVCPVGALLGLFAARSLLRVRFDAGACRECGRCERACKADCIDFKAKTVDAGRCVACGNCLAACRDHALRLTAPGAGGAMPGKDPGRRKFLVGLIGGSLGLAAVGARAAEPPKVVPSRPTTIPEKRTSPVSPPGSVGIEHFTAKCTACHLCVSACPSRVLAPSFLAYGLAGVMQPQMWFEAAHCNYDCTVCSEVCPSGAILPLTRERKRRTQTGVAHFIKENCVVHMDNTNCGACSEHCPTKAVHMVPYPNPSGRRLVIPEVNEAICVGCGGCEHACPTRPFRAIFVDGNPVHKRAEKPAEKKLEPLPEAGGDFPF